MRSLFLSAFFLFLVNSAFAAERLIIVDAGSSGTRLHVYEVGENTVEEIIPSLKVKPGISSFVDSQQRVNEAGLSTNIQNLIKTAQAKLPTVTDYPIYVYATAGMRLVSAEAQQTAMSTIQKTLSDLGFQHPTAKVIPGEDEALYDWVSLNADNLLSNTHSHTTVGALDLGGASLEIAYEALELEHSPDIHTLHFHHKTYRIYAKSYLGLGADQMIANTNTNYLNNREVCYPKDTWSPELRSDPKGFDYLSCSSNLLDYLQHYEIAPVMEDSPSFKAFSAFYYTDAIFNNTDLGHLSDVVSAECTLDWENFQIADNHKTQIPYLQPACLEGVYVTTILKNALHLRDNQINFGTDGIDWTKGAALLLSQEYE